MGLLFTYHSIPCALNYLQGSSGPTILSTHFRHSGHESCIGRASLTVEISKQMWWVTCAFNLLATLELDTICTVNCCK